MPKEGFKTITVSLEVYEILDEYAKETHRSIPQVVSLLADQAKNNPEKEVS